MNKSPDFGLPGDTTTEAVMPLIPKGVRRQLDKIESAPPPEPGTFSGKLRRFAQILDGGGEMMPNGQHRDNYEGHNPFEEMC